MSNVFVVDTLHKPLDPVHSGYARKLLSSGKAAVYRRFPFTIILRKEVHEPRNHPLRVKLDPGSKTTGIAIVNDASGEVVFAAELQHRGQAVKEALESRRRVRRGRRQRKMRQKSYLGFQTGDIVKAVVPQGKYQGTHEGRIAIRFRPSFRLNGFDVAPKHLKRIHRSDGYRY